MSTLSNENANPAQTAPADSIASDKTEGSPSLLELLPVPTHNPNEEAAMQAIGSEISKHAKDFRKFMSYYACAITEIQAKFQVLNEEFSHEAGGNPIESIRSRLKSPESLAGKIKRKGIEPTLEAVEGNIYDIAGVRVICSFIEDIYALADCILKQDDITLVRKKDYIANPKPNGYRGLHLIVEVPIFLSEGKRMMKVEIQLRTIAMDFWAALEHKMRYKKNLDSDVTAKISQGLKNAAETAAALDADMQEIRHDIHRAMQAEA